MRGEVQGVEATPLRLSRTDTVLPNRMLTSATARKRRRPFCLRGRHRAGRRLPPRPPGASKSSTLSLSAVSTCFAMNIPLVAPVFPAGKEPLPPGITEEERDNYMQARKYQNWMTMGMESCVVKSAIAGVGGILK